MLTNRFASAARALTAFYRGSALEKNGYTLEDFAAFAWERQGRSLWKLKYSNRALYAIAAAGYLD